MDAAVNDQQAADCLEAVIDLALSIRDDGPAEVRQAAQLALDAAGGDPIAALAVAAALVHIDESVDPWWQAGLEGVGVRHGTVSGYRAHRKAGERPIECQPCKAAHAAEVRERRQRAVA